MAVFASKLASKVERVCVGCFKKYPQNELLALKRLKNGEILVDFEQKWAGRGVYLCKKLNCYQRAVKRKGKNALEYGLKLKVPPEVLMKLEQLFAENPKLQITNPK